jgi:hypothetical protein
VTQVNLQTNPVPVGDIDATGTPGSTTFLRGDGSWAEPSGSGGGADWSPILDTKSTPDDPPDDEFDDTTGMSGVTNGLDAKWTVQAGASGTVALTETGNVSEYDLTTRAGWLLMQAGSNGSQAVSIYQDFTLGDGESIVAAFASTPVISDDATYTNNERRTGLSLTSGGTDPAAGDPYVWIGAPEVDANEPAIRYMTSTAATFDALGKLLYRTGDLVYLRIARASLAYYGFVSFNGITWAPLGVRTLSAAPTRLWLFDINGAAHDTPAPVTGFLFVRKGTNALDLGW